MSNYCIDIFEFGRHKTQEVTIGDVNLGASNPIVVQSMTTTNTNETEETVAQIKTIIDAGGQMVRMTTQGQREAKNLEHIKAQLVKEGYNQPLVADIHYNPNAANIAALHIEKVRINPGNFVDGAKKFENIDYTNESYLEELEQVKKKLIPLLNICKQNKTTIRIGTNHGSLSDRIMSRYGDTPQGMVEACMEFLRICKDEKFFNIVLSIKASNARIMVHTVRLLVQKMNEEDMYFPLHLGVTEAGEGEDGRIRSAVGIGTLLMDGIGDTIRVSLTENPEKEIPVANQIIDYINTKEGHDAIKKVDTDNYSPFKYTRHQTNAVKNIGGNNVPVVIGNNHFTKDSDYIYIADSSLIISADKKEYPVVKYSNSNEFDFNNHELCFVKIAYSDMDDSAIQFFKQQNNVVILLTSNNSNSTIEQRAAFLHLRNHHVTTPVVIHKLYDSVFDANMQIQASCDMGPLFIDGFGDGIFIENNTEDQSLVINTMFAVLQASRVRFSRPDYISCPGCGRTLFGLQDTTILVKEKTAHLKGLKIAVMGCIVNGPGEMADADYGYVGSGPGKVTLYHQREVVKKNINQEDAIGELVALIKGNGDWVEPS